MCAQGLDAYRKNREDMYQVLFPYMETAIANAKALAARNEGKTPAESAPGTEVYRLFKKIKTVSSGRIGFCRKNLKAKK